MCSLDVMRGRRSVQGEMKKPVLLVGLGMVLAFVIMAAVVGFSSLVFADRGVVLVDNSDIDVALSVLESTSAGRTPTPALAETGDDPSAQARATAPPFTPQPGSSDATRAAATRALVTPTRTAALAPDQPREDDGAETEDAEHVIDRRDESYRAQLLRAYDLVTTVRPRVNRPIRRRVASPTPASIIGPAPTQDANATPVAIATATLAPLPDANTPQPPASAQPAQPTAQPTQPASQPQPTQPPAPKPTEDHDADHGDDDHDEDRKPEPTKQLEPTETHH